MPQDYGKTPEALNRLTRLQYRVTQEDETEPAFRNRYWDNHDAGLYVDVVSRQPLFSSIEKLESGSGWPCFTGPLHPDAARTRIDRTLPAERVEVRSAGADSHLGHLFDDGPQESGGLRYCINSAALRFVPVAAIEAQGYGEYRSLFEAATTDAEGLHG